VGGGKLPDFTLTDVNGHPVTLSSFYGKQRVVVTFDRSVDWWPYTKSRLVELHQTLASVPDLTVLYVMSGGQIDPKARKFIADHRLAPFVFLVDDDHRVIDQFGIFNNHPDSAIEKGVPHRTTDVLDRNGLITLKDSRKDFRIWLDSSMIRDTLAQNH
jgi:peroxiredoxin Q/BCP